MKQNICSPQAPRSEFRLRSALYRAAFSALRWTALGRTTTGWQRLPAPQSPGLHPAGAACRVCLSAAAPEGVGAGCHACSRAAAGEPAVDRSSGAD